MRRKKAFVLCLLSIALLVVVLAKWCLEKEYAEKKWAPVETEKEVMGIAIVKNADVIAGKQRVTAEKNPGIFFENTMVPYDIKENTLYLSQNLCETGWQGELSVRPGAFLCMAEDVCWEDKEKAIREGHIFTIWLVEEEIYYEISMAISGMPVIDIATERMEIQEKVPYEVDPDKLYYGSEDLYYGDIRVFDSGSGKREYEITECRVRYHLKGATTKGFDKKGYAISLQDSRSNNIDVSLLGMREDNSWKLNALVTDPNRIREITASQIWSQIDEANTSVSEPGPRMEYVELVVDNDYRGLYCLVEPVDEKKLELDHNDILYKVIDWIPCTDEDIQIAVDSRWRIMFPVRIRYPEKIVNYEVAWYPIRDYISKLFYSHDGFQNISEMVHPENAHDMTIFLMTVAGNDNFFKNLFYAADVEEDGSYTMRQIPWDLDLTFGNVYEYSSPIASIFEDDVTVEYTEVSNAFLLQYAPNSVEEILLGNWRKYRSDFLSTDNVCKLMLDNRDYLVNTGVVARENERWPEYIMETDIEYLLEFQRNRMDWLDGYFEGLVN